MSLTIGTLAIDSPVFLAPMTGVTDRPFRRMVKKFGAGLVFSEMIASRPMMEQARRNKSTARHYEDEYKIAAQIAGCEPDIMAEAAQLNEARGACLIDLNFGCPVKKIVNNFAGSALMRNENLAADIMSSVVGAVQIPVTVKMRLGWDDTSRNAPKLARMAEDIGVQMITVHGRTRCQLYNGTADWEAVQAVKDAVKIPVIVNGDITNTDMARKALAKSGADGVMIGRGVFGKPWVVQQITDGLRGHENPAPGLMHLRDLILEHYDDILAYHGLHTGIGMARKHIGWYIGHLPRSDEIRSLINRMDNPDEVKRTIAEYFDNVEI